VYEVQEVEVYEVHTGYDM